MAKQPVIRCLVDDTALTRDIAEIETWVSQGNIILVVPLYTIGRLHVLKKDSSPIGHNARKAVKFLDRSTSSRGDLSHDPVILQGPDEEYPTWAEVETHYLNESMKTAGVDEEEPSIAVMDKKQEKDAELTLKSSAAGALSQMLLDKLNFAKEPAAVSPTSTPPLSPASSGPQSAKTSPEVKAATMINHDQTPVPPSLKPLLNSAVWYVQERKYPEGENLVFLTNSADTMHLARDFGIPTKNIHQLRSALGLEDGGATSHESSKKDTIKKAAQAEPKTLFSYEDADSDDEEVVFKPRGRASTRGAQSSRSQGAGQGRAKGAHGHSPRSSFSTSTPGVQSKPQIPVQEIDPDSFDRGSFGRGSTPLVNTSNLSNNQFLGTRGSGHRGGQGQGAGRGGSHARGHGRGLERGSARGRGRLFVP